ncbi:cell division protein FtsI (penicillin-binding protein 3) [Mesonia hippocampi]|uniref:Cell division protein FtsI (Penicillin-binding protein 3) n=1 Tax=Mesonia hippocampi TaxID=1628250 RepID=A0A840EJU1_9FLAO|nr:penicillin-binding protein [Mesonia hippocampi]MBB4118649.1 cell division protein FtsI (penicillin-binding protein 3) [Mesonia hippocampi]
MTTEKNILKKLYLVAGLMLLLVLFIVFKLVNIQVLEGDKYRELAQKTVYKNFVIPANRGNLYDVNQNLLATSVPEYDIRFDAVTVSEENFNKNLRPLSDSLSKLLGRSSSYYQTALRRARANKNRYFLVARNLDYFQYTKIRNFPIFNLGAYKGGFIAEQETVRELPLGKIGERTVGRGQAGLEGAYDQYLRGSEGHRLKQKIAKGQWKPLSDANEVEPKDGLDVVSTIDVNIQDIAHHALLAQLEKYKADHGTVVVMDTKSGEIKAMANLGVTSEGTYYEKRNYAIWESHEPGSTFKLMTLVAALEDKVIDTSDVFDTENGRIKYYDRIVKDSRIGGYGEISVARAFEVSSNTVFSRFITEGYKDNPEAFIDRLDYMGLNKTLGVNIKGEGKPRIPHPDDKNWYGTTLPWMSFGYGVLQTPLQTLAFYNAVANDGIMVKPRLIRAVKDKSKYVEHYTKPEILGTVCSKETAKKAQAIMENTISRGTGSRIYSKEFSMAGKTGTCLTGYGSGRQNSEYIASFAGYFPADNPKYSCIVVISKPDKNIGFYGGIVAAPVFKQIAQKIYTNTPVTDSINLKGLKNIAVETAYEDYYTKAQKYKTIVPNVIGLPVMDAVSLLENLGLKVKTKGIGVIKEQSVAQGNKVKANQLIYLQAS